MLPGPILRREMRAAADGRKLFLNRLTLAAIIAVFLLPSAWFVFGPDGPSFGESGVPRHEAARIYAAGVLVATVAVEIWALIFAAAGSAAVSIAEEREKDTLSLLLLTRLTRLELAATKLAGRLVPPLLLMLTGVPLILFGAWVADLPAPLIVEVLAMIASTTAVAGSLGILASSRRDRSSTASAEAAAWAMIWIVGLPVAALMPVRSGTLWGELLIELRRLAGWLAPSSPVSLLTDSSWYTSGAAYAPDLLSDRLLTMLAMQAVIIVLALAGSTAGLRLREPHPTAWDPHRGYRPPVGDDPIFWREHELPRRGSRVPAVAMLARRLLIVLRALLVLALSAVLLAMAVAIPIGVALATGWFGYFAFRESWGLDTPPLGIPVARQQFNFFIRAVTVFLGPTAMMGAAAAAAGQIAIERDKKTWESLLTTPLTGPEILSSKLRVTAKGIWGIVRWLIPLWSLGILCGALHPLGVVLAAAGLWTGTRLGLAVGLKAAIRPGTTSRSATSASGLWALALMLVGALTVVAPLVSAFELRALRTYDGRLPWLAAVVFVAPAVAMAARAHSLTRRCFDRFDEWIDRPHRTDETERPGGGVRDDWSRTDGDGRAAPAPAGRSGDPRLRIAVGVDREIVVEPAQPQHVPDDGVGPRESQATPDLLQPSVQLGEHPQHVAGHRLDAREIQHEPGMARVDQATEPAGQRGDVVPGEEEPGIPEFDDGALRRRPQPDGWPLGPPVSERP